MSNSMSNLLNILTALLHLRSQISVIFVCIHLFFHLNGQTVTYSFETGFVDKFPFDQNFSIKFTDVPSDVNLIEVSIWTTTKAQKIQRALYRNHKNGAKTKLSNEILLGHKKIPPNIYANTEIILPDSDNKYQSKIDFAHKLYPNESYFIEISTGRYTKLNSNQQDEIKKTLSKSNEIDSLIIKLIAHYLPSGSLDFSYVTDTLKPELISQTQTVLDRLNSNYRISEPDPLELESRIKEIKLSEFLVNINNKFDEIFQKIPDPISYNNLRAIINKNINTFNFSDTLNLLNLFKHIIPKNIYSIDEILIGHNVKTIINYKSQLDSILVNKIIMAYTGCYTAINQTYLSDAVENSKKYLFADLGYGYASGVTHFSQAAVSIYLRPINESIPPKHYSGIDRWLTRTSIIAGATITGNISTPTRKGIISDNQGVLLGLGFRFIPGVKINGGYMFYYDYPSPLVSRANPKWAPFISLAIDFSVTPSFKNAFNK